MARVGLNCHFTFARYMESLIKCFLVLLVTLKMPVIRQNLPTGKPNLPTGKWQVLVLTAILLLQCNQQTMATTSSFTY